MTAPQLNVVVQGQGSVSADNLNTYYQTCDLVSQLATFVGAPGVQVFARGVNAVNDGSGGAFYWNSTSTGPNDGVNVIVPVGAALGAWIRISSGSIWITTPEEFGAVGNGTADDTVALRGFFGALGTSASLGIMRFGATYLTSIGITVSNSNFGIEGAGATIKMANGAAVDSNHFILKWTGANAVVRNLLTDGNRANRTPGGAQNLAHNMYLDGASFMTFQNCQGNNAVVDNWYVSGSSETTPSTFTHDIQLLNCFGNNAARNNLSIIVSAGVDVIGGEYNNANGTSPSTGIDIEADAGAASPSNYKVRIIGPACVGNTGTGLGIGANGSPEAVFVDKVTIDGTGAGNARGFTLATNDISIGTIVLRNFTYSIDTICFQAQGVDLNIDRLMLQSLTGPPSLQNDLCYALGASGRVGLIYAENCTPGLGSVFYMDQSVGMTIENVYMNTCGRSDVDCSMITIGFDSKILAAHFESCSGTLCESNGSGSTTNNSYTNITANSCDVGAPTVQGIVVAKGGDYVDKIRVTNPTISADSYVILAPASVLGYVGHIDAPNDPNGVTGYSPSHMIDCENPPELTITSSGGSTTLNAGTVTVIYTGGGTATIVLPSSLAYPGGQQVNIRIINDGSGNLTISPASGDSVAVGGTLSNGAAKTYSCDVTNRNWYGF